MSIIIPSRLDRSVNFVDPQEIGYLEARYVRRSDDYFIAYVSSQTGCSRGCKFCHLTASGQRQYRDSTLQDYLDQLEQVIGHYRAANHPAKVCHINAMGRGEILANKHFIDDPLPILDAMGKRLIAEGLAPKFNLSTIMPVTLKKSLVELFPLITPTIYYSLYSMDPAWRQEWMPAAMDPNTALDLIAEYQRVSKKIVKIHGAFIEGENDSISSVREMMFALSDRNIRYEVNIVEYNPLTRDHGTGSSRIPWIVKMFEAQDVPVKVIPAVGKDCGASCGSFYPVHDLTKNVIQQS